MPDIREEASRLLSVPEEELLIQIVPEEEGVAYSESGRIARGREILHELARPMKDAVCPIYRRNKDVLGHSVDAVLLVVGALTAQALVWGVPVLPLSVLVVKIGLDVFCADAGQGGH